eukprot:3240372-Alexandrium_andersonii.AAC.1
MGACNSWPWTWTTQRTVLLAPLRSAIGSSSIARVAPLVRPSVLGRLNGMCPSAAFPRRSGGDTRRAPLLRLA